MTGPADRKEPKWFVYFPGDYRWSAAMLGLLSTAPYGGADIGEVDRVGRSLRAQVGDDGAWFAAWRAEGERLRALGEEAEAAGHEATAASVFLRACSYLQMGERFRVPKDAAALESYRTAVGCFHRFIRLTRRPRIEQAEIPYSDGSLPAYLVHPEDAAGGPAPCVVYFDGLDITKELQYLRGAAEIARRGLACLIVDGPGNGEAIRFRGFPLRFDYEYAGTAALDYLESRSDIDAGQVGVMAISLGGYYATRIAALESRYQAAVAWGAIWDYHATWQRRIEAGFRTQLSVPGQHIGWVLGTGKLDEALDMLRDFRLDGVAQRIRCPFLLLHGADDEQVPLADARALFDAVGSSDKTLRVFTAEEGGAQHCQHDYLTMAVSTIADWLAGKLGPRATPNAPRPAP